jgi:hypothetical protein
MDGAMLVGGTIAAVSTGLAMAIVAGRHGGSAGDAPKPGEEDDDQSEVEAPLDRSD